MEQEASDVTSKQPALSELCKNALDALVEKTFFEKIAFNGSVVAGWGFRTTTNRRLRDWVDAAVTRG